METDSQKLKASASSIKSVTGSGDMEGNSLLGSALTAADLQIGWVRGTQDNTGKPVRRFIVLITDEWADGKLPNPGNRGQFKGDGSDTCQTTLPLKSSPFAKIIKDNDIQLIGAYVALDHVHNNYIRQFATRLGDRHCYRTEVFTNVTSFASELEDHVAGCVQKFLGTGNTTTQQGPCQWQDPPAHNTLGY